MFCTMPAPAGVDDHPEEAMVRRLSRARLLTGVLQISVLAVLLAACAKQSSQSQSADSTATASSSGATGGGEPLPADIERTTDAVPLRMRFEKGASFGYAITVVQRVTLTRDTMVEKNLQEIRYRYRFRVLESLPDGSGRLEATCTAVSFRGEYGGAGTSRTLEYDSEKRNDASKEKLFAQYNAPVNTPYVMVVSSLGTITKVESVDAVLRRLMGDDYATTKMEAKQRLERELADQTLKGIVQMAFQKFEQRPIAPDSSWTITQDERLGYLSIRNHAAYTLRGFTSEGDGRRAHIDIHITSTYTGTKKVDTGQGMATLDEFSVDGRGRTVFDMTAGNPLKRSFTQRMRVRFFVEPPEELKKLVPDQAKDFWMTQDASVENTIERL